MCEERIMVHFDEANLDLYDYALKHKNKSAFIRECIRYKMEQEKSLKEVVIEALKEFLGDSTASVLHQPVKEQLNRDEEDIKEVADFFEAY